MNIITAAQNTIMTCSMSNLDKLWLNLELETNYGQ